MSTETPAGVGGLLAELDALARRGLASAGATIEVVTLLPVLPATSRFLPSPTHDESSLRYEVRGPLGGRHSLRVMVGEDGFAVGHYSYDYVPPMFRSMPRTHFDGVDVEGVAASLAENEAAQVERKGASRREGSSTIAASNAEVEAFLTALVRSDPRALEPLVREHPALARWYHSVLTASNVSGETDSATLAVATSLLSDLTAGVTPEWAARRAAGAGA